MNGIKVFTATKTADREMLGERVSEWLSQFPDLPILKKVVVQSSDKEYHCLSIVIMF